MASTEVEAVSAVMVVDVVAAAEVLAVPPELRDAMMSLKYSQTRHAVNAQPTNLLESPEGNCTS